MAKDDSSSTGKAGSTKDAVSSNDGGLLCRSVPADRFDRATLKIEGARALVTMFGIFAADADGGSGELPVTGSLIEAAMSGIGCLIESAVDDLATCQATAADA